MDIVNSGMVRKWAPGFVCDLEKGVVEVRWGQSHV